MFPPAVRSTTDLIKDHVEALQIEGGGCPHAGQQVVVGAHDTI
jgi:hypothetical protein